MVPVNFLAVLVSAFASMIIGSLWYGPLFGKTWSKMMGFNSGKWQSAEFKPTDMPKMLAIQFVASFVMAYVLLHSIAFASAYLKISGVSAGLQGAFWNWVGIMAPFSLGTVLWEGKPWKLWIINNAYYLVSLSVMGVILSLWV